MSESLFSPSWYRVAGLRPRLRRDARLHRHRYRGELWYVLQDPSSGRCHRLAPSAYWIVGLMDGQLTAQEIWETASAQLGDDAPTQDETIRLLGLLHGADVLLCDVPPDTEEILRRGQRREQAEWWQRVTNPLSVKVPLVDPDRFLVALLPWVRPLFSRAGAALWLALVGAAVFLAGTHWAELTSDATSRLLATQNLLVLLAVYPAVKLVHELGHAFATRVWDGEVHEAGVLFLVLMPLPYVDASASSAFPEKHRRMIVAGAGIAVELLLAALALFAWLAVEPGLIRQIAYNVMWIGGVSTLLFNGNPLLRFDGYYVLADAVEIPNLAARANQYLGYVTLRHGFGLERTRYPVSAPGEAGWFACYGIAAFFYRLFVLFAIAIFLSSRFLLLGLTIAAFAVIMQIAVPLGRHAVFLLSSPRLGERRARALTLTAAAALAGVILLLVVPVPLRTHAQGVVWPPEHAQLRATTDGFVVRVLAEPDAIVAKGQPLIETRDPSLEAHVAVLAAEARSLRARLHAERTQDRVKAKMTSQELATAEAELARAREELAGVVIRSPGSGRFVLSGGRDLTDRFAKKGELLGYVLGPEVPLVRAVVPEAAIPLVREHTSGVKLRLAARPRETLRGELVRTVPAASQSLPTRALGSAGGGPFAVDPSDEDGLTTLEPFFEVDVALPDGARVDAIGARAHLKFEHGAEPVALRAYRALRRLFLRQVRV